MPNAFGEKARAQLMFGAMIRAAERWRAVKVTEFERRQMAAVKQDLTPPVESPPPQPITLSATPPPTGVDHTTSP